MGDGVIVSGKTYPTGLPPQPAQPPKAPALPTTKPAPLATLSPQDADLVRKIAQAASAHPTGKAAHAAAKAGNTPSPQSRLAEDLAVTVVNSSTALADTLKGMKAPLSGEDRAKVMALVKLSESSARSARERAATDRNTGGTDTTRMDMAEVAANLDFSHRNMLEMVRKAARDQKFNSPEGLHEVIGALGLVALDVSQKIDTLSADDAKQLRAAVHKEIKNLKQTDEGTKKLFE